MLVSGFIRPLQYAESAEGMGAYNIVAERYGYDDPDSIRKKFQARDPAWDIKEQPKEKLQADIDMYRKLLKK